MDKQDLEHLLQMGAAIYFENIPTHKISLAEMVRFGYTKAQGIISLLCMDDEKAGEFLPPAITPSTFSLIAVSMLKESLMAEKDKSNIDELKDTLLYSVPAFLSLLFHSSVTFLPDQVCFEIQTDGPARVIDQNNYGHLREILKERNCLADLDEIDSENPANGNVRQLLERKKKLRERLKKARTQTTGADEDSPITMADLISIFAESAHMPLQDVYEKYDIYQFNNQFNRLRIMDDYHINIQMLLAGAKKEDVKLTHYITKIKKRDHSF